jgi:hypothetical protein
MHIRDRSAIPPLPALPGVPTTESGEPKGVRYAAPPAELVPSIMDSIAKAMETVIEREPDAKGAVVGQATTAGWNAAIVVKAPGGFDVEAWIGSTWGKPIDGGVKVLKVLRW